MGTNSEHGINVQCKVSNAIVNVMKAYGARTGMKQTDIVRLALIRMFDIGGAELSAIEHVKPTTAAPSISATELQAGVK